MLADDRIRAGFERNGSSIRPETAAALTSVVKVARRRMLIRRSVLLAGAALSAIALVVMVPRGLDALHGLNVPQPGQTYPIPSTTSSPVPIPDLLSGTWRASSSCAQQAAAVENAGLTQAAARLHFRCRGPRLSTVVFHDGILETRGSGDGVGWRGPYRVLDADTFVAGHESFGGELYLRYHFTVRGRTLTVHLLDDAYPRRGAGRDQRAGDLLAQTIGWDSSLFHRVADEV